MQQNFSASQNSLSVNLFLKIFLLNLVAELFWNLRIGVSIILSLFSDLLNKNLK